jgi:uncharacterized protein YggE
MRTSVTFTVRSLVITAAATLAVLAAYVIGSTQAATSTAVAAQEPVSADSPSIVMTGTGDATGTPDQLKFSLEVRTTATDVSTAIGSANATTRRVLSAVEEQGVESEDIQTTGLSINTTYDYSSEGPPVITGYAVTESMSVIVRKLPDAGATISAAISAGGNAVRLSNVRLQIADEDALMDEARAAAIDEARAKAEQYAAAAGRELGEVSSVREVNVSPGGNQVYGLAAARDSAYLSKVPIRAGTAEVDVTVSVVWELA